MNKLWFILLALFVMSSLFAYEVIHYQETFESGATGWTHIDGAVSPNNWHIYNAGGTQGNVWWMGDPALASGNNIGGYYDHQYLVLDTPVIQVPAANPTLTFKLRYAVEPLSGGYPTGYNGWDACNVRISTNNGQTWTVISGTPAYNMTSSYAFGFEHGEGTGIAGWGGSLTTWTNASFNLSAYAGQNVKIRFAFASDPSYSTGDAPALFGMMVDDISLGSYTNNGVNDGQMTWASLVPLGGDLWHIATDAAAPSPTHVMACTNANNTYNPNMMNYLVSPPIQLPVTGDIRADFMIKGSFDDNNTFPEVDYFGWEISINNGITWYAMSNPYGSSTGSNYVYSDAPPDWASMVESYNGVDGYITDYAGETAIFRWFFRSDADTPIGTGIFIDNFVIYNDIFIAEPTNLQATVLGNNVQLTWVAPGQGGGGEPGWLHYDSGVNDDAIGTGQAADFDVAMKYNASGENNILPYVGMNVTQIKFWPNEVACQYSVRIWTGSNANTLVVDQAVPNVTIGAWNTVTLTTPFTIPPMTTIWIGYRCNTTTGYPAGVDAGPAVNGYGNMIRLGGSWSTLTSITNPPLDCNWNIQAYVDDAPTGKLTQIVPLPINIQEPFYGTLTKSGNPNRNREVTAYKIYRDDALIATVDPNLLTYTDQNVPGGIHSYKVSAMYGTNESLFSNVVTVFVVPVGYSEIFYNDGTSEVGYSVGPTKMMAVKFQHTHVDTLKYVKIYAHTVGTAPMIIRVFDDDGANGLPGTQLTQFTYPAASIVQGWNYIPLPAGNPIVANDGRFYIALLEYTNASQIGMDTSQNGHSWKKITTVWEPITEGEVMIHAIVANGPTGNEEEILPVTKLSASNYPNPFNPTTTISYNVPKDGKTTLKIYNTKGQVVRTLINETVKSGRYRIVWNGTDDQGNKVSSGIYFYKLTNGNHTVTKKMLLSK